MFEHEDNTERFFIEAVGWDGEALKLGLGWLARYALENGHSEAAIAVGIKAQIGRMKPALPAALADPLENNGEVQTDGLRLVRIIDRGMPWDFPSGPILAVWKDDRRLEKIDALGAPAVCVITWSEGNIDQWKAAWGPTDLRSGQAVEQQAIANPVVRVALEDLTTSVNLNSGLSHPSDREHAIQLLRALQSAGELFKADEVRGWAMSHGWQPEHATDLGELAQKIIEGRRLRAGRQYLKADVIDRLREEAAERYPDE